MCHLHGNVMNTPPKHTEACRAPAQFIFCFLTGWSREESRSGFFADTSRLHKIWHYTHICLPSSPCHQFKSGALGKLVTSLNESSIARDGQESVTARASLRDSDTHDKVRSPSKAALLMEAWSCPVLPCHIQMLAAPPAGLCRRTSRPVSAL